MKNDYSRKKITVQAPGLKIKKVFLLNLLLPLLYDKVPLKTN